MALATVAEIVASLNGSGTSPGPFTIFGQSLTEASLQSALDFSEDYVYTVTGPSRIATFLANVDVHIQKLPKRAVISYASMRILSMMQGNMMVSGMSISTGQLSIEKGNFPTMLQNAINQYKSDFERYIRMLMRPVLISMQGETIPEANGVYLREDSPGQGGLNDAP